MLIMISMSYQLGNWKLISMILYFLFILALTPRVYLQRTGSTEYVLRRLRLFYCRRVIQCWSTVPNTSHKCIGMNKDHTDHRGLILHWPQLDSFLRYRHWVGPRPINRDRRRIHHWTPKCLLVLCHSHR